MVIHKHFDRRVQALEKLLLGKIEQIEGREVSWAGSGLSAEVQDDRIRVKGQVEVGRRAFQFEHVFKEASPLVTASSTERPLKLENSSVMPRSLDDRYQKALILAGYLARNKAQYEDAVRKKKTYTVDESLLSGGFR